MGKHLNFASAGHLVMAEYPDDVNDAIAELLTSTYDPGLK